ncbi:MAG: NAD(P)/FAD-dependent oxidoreductase [Candidatus Heimdallarchaeota archaeon]
MDAVIVGNSRAAIEAIRSFRQYDQDSPLTLLSKENLAGYCRPLIAEYLSGEKSYKEILYVSPDFYNEKKVNLLKGVEAVKLDTERKEILTNQGQKIAFDRLLIATGSKPVIPPIPGADLAGVYTFWTIGDAQDIAKRAEKAESAVVVGAGLVGMSAIHALHARGLQVSVVEMLDRVLTPCLDAPGSEIIQQKMRRSGINLHLKKKLTAIKEEPTSSSVLGVELDDGTKIPCQLVVVAAGVRPNIDFLRASPLNVNDGIIVNENLETSIPNIFAAGDAAQPYDILHNENKIIANLPNASEQGRIAGANLAGQKTSYKGGITMTSMRYFGIPFVSMGILSKSEPLHQETSVHNSDMSIYRKLITTERRIIGAVLVGDINQGGIILRMIHEKISTLNPEDLLERNHEFEVFRKELMRETMEGGIQWKETIGLEQPWRKNRDKIPVSKEESV